MQRGERGRYGFGHFSGQFDTREWTAGKGTTRNPLVTHIGLAVPGSHILETRYGEVSPRGDYGQYRLFFSQVFYDYTISGKTKDPAGRRGIVMLIVSPEPDFEGTVRPASRDGMDPNVIQSEADEQVFNIPNCHIRVLNDRSAFSSQERWLSERCDNQLSNLFKWTQNSPELL